MENNIPDEVRKQIELIVSHHTPVEHRPVFRQCLEQGYSLASKALSDANNRVAMMLDEVKASRDALSDANKEIERLKGLMVKAFNTFRYTPFPHNEPDYEDFAKENKI